METKRKLLNHKKRCESALEKVKLELRGEWMSTSDRRYYEQNNINKGAKRLYVELLTKRLGKYLLAEITPQDCRDAQWRLQKTMSDSSVNRVMSTSRTPSEISLTLQ